MVLGPSMIPLMPIQLLWLNLVTDSFPALALGQEMAEPDIMLQPPRKRTDKILNKEMVLSIVSQAIAIFSPFFSPFISEFQTMDSETKRKTMREISVSIARSRERTISSEKTVQSTKLLRILEENSSGLPEVP